MESMKSAHRIANTSGLYQIQKVDKLLYMSIYVFLFLFFFSILLVEQSEKVFIKVLNVSKKTEQIPKVSSGKLPVVCSDTSAWHSSRPLLFHQIRPVPSLHIQVV